MSLVRVTLLSICTVLLVLSPLVVRAQDSTGKAHSVTGCLQKGVEEGGFYMFGKDGKMWELSGKIDGNHVGHKVTVTGHTEHKAKVQEAKLDESEKKEANGKPYGDLEVTSLKMVRESCK